MGTRLHDRLLAIWYGDSDRGRWLAPLSWLFGILVRARRSLYRMGWLPVYRSPCPVIVVGNLTVGGTGKTPFVIWLARALVARGLRVGIASRGFGGENGRPRRIAASDPPGIAGDEALLLVRKLSLPVAIAARRAAAVRLLEPDCDLVLCDDGLQHYALARDIEIAVVDGERRFGNGRLLPAGPLREPVSRLREVDAVVVNGEGTQLPDALRMTLRPVAAVALDGRSRRPLSEFAGRQVTAVAAIGHPARFFMLLRQHGMTLREIALPDHATPSPSALRLAQGQVVLMTEKDAVKCPPDEWREAWYVEVEALVEGAAAEALIERIAKLHAARQQGGSP